MEPLRKALAHRNNFIVAKAADLVGEFRMAQLIPDLRTAFDRFFHDAVKTDPQCWAKNAISRALFALEHQEPEVYLRGMRHIQNEPVWGGQSDTAGTLRAIEQVGSPSASLLLRLRAVLGSDEPEVLGACYSGILRLEGAKAIPWIARFLAAADDNAAEAALAIAGTHSPEGFETLRECLTLASDPWWRSVLLSAIALTRQDAALEFLLDEIRKESLNAETAIEAILRSMPSSETVSRLKKLTAGKPRLARLVAANQNTAAT